MQNNNQDLDMTIAQLTKRVYHLEQEVIRLGGNAYDANKQVEASLVESKVRTQTVRTKSVNPQTARPKLEKTKIDRVSMENKIGKNLMAIIASILIFCSLILFGGIAFRYLSDLAKAIIMYAVSIAVTVVGIVKIPSKNVEQARESAYRFKTFFTALAACGIGLIHITSLISYFTFNIFSIWIFALSLAVWIIVTMFLAYRYADIFVYICNLGLIISTVLVTFQLDNCLLGFAIYTVCLFALYIIKHSTNYNRDCFYFIQYPVIFIILSSIVETGSAAYIIAGLVLFVIFALANIIYTVEEKHVGTNLATLILNIVAIMYISTTNSGENIFRIITLVMLTLTAAFYWIKYHSDSKLLAYMAYGICLLLSVVLFSFTTSYVFVSWLPYVLLIIIGFICKDKVIRIGGYIMVFPSLIAESGVMNYWFIYVTCILVLICAALAMRFIDYSLLDKYCITVCAYFAIYTVSDILSLDSWVSFSLCAIISILANSNIYRKNLLTKEPEESSELIAYIINAISILAGYVLISSRYSLPSIYQVIIVSAFTLVLCSINIKRLFRMSIPEMLIGIYVCLKYSILIVAILKRLEAASFLISIAGIVIAITCIILGFKFRKKSFRLYGLVVSLISVAKLILFDIKYDSDILRPIGFFVAGVLCFAISFTYSKLEKTVGKAEEKIEDSTKAS